MKKGARGDTSMYIMVYNRCTPENAVPFERYFFNESNGIIFYAPVFVGITTVFRRQYYQEKTVLNCLRLKPISEYSKNKTPVL